MKKRKHTAAIAVIAAITAIVAAIVVYGFMHDTIDDHAWESRNITPKIVIDTITPGTIIDSTGIRGMALIGEETAMAVRRLSATFDIDSIVTGDSPAAVNYTLSRNSTVEIILQNSYLGRISAIFILG